MYCNILSHHVSMYISTWGFSLDSRRLRSTCDERFLRCPLHRILTFWSTWARSVTYLKEWLLLATHCASCPQATPHRGSYSMAPKLRLPFACALACLWTLCSRQLARYLWISLSRCLSRTWWLHCRYTSEFHPDFLPFARGSMTVRTVRKVSQGTLMLAYWQWLSRSLAVCSA